MTTRTAPESLPWTGQAEADRLIATDPNALLIGFVLDQQVTVQKAFSGPLELSRRIGHLDVGRIAAMDPLELGEAFRTRPALHRYPGVMATRVQGLCSHLAEQHDGDAANVWERATTGAELRARLGKLPGIGDMKMRALVVLLTKQYGVRPPGWEAELPGFPTLGDVTTAEELAAYQEGKRAFKAAKRAAAAEA